MITRPVHKMSAKVLVRPFILSLELDERWIYAKGVKDSNICAYFQEMVGENSLKCRLVSLPSTVCERLEKTGSSVSQIHGYENELNQMQSIKDDIQSYEASVWLSSVGNNLQKSTLDWNLMCWQYAACHQKITLRDLERILSIYQFSSMFTRECSEKKYIQQIWSKLMYSSVVWSPQLRRPLDVVKSNGRQQKLYLK